MSNDLHAALIIAWYLAANEGNQAILDVPPRFTDADIEYAMKEMRGRRTQCQRFGRRILVFNERLLGQPAAVFACKDPKAPIIGNVTVILAALTCGVSLRFPFSFFGISNGVGFVREDTVAVDSLV